MMAQGKFIGSMVLAAAVLAGCSALPVDRQNKGEQRFSAIAEDEAIKVVGTEPFWGGTVDTGRFTYTTPEKPDGDRIAVKRFAGLSGLGYSGTLDGKPVDLTITVGACSDGMSDRQFPFTATLRIGEEIRQGCAWTERSPFTGPANP